MKLTNEQAGNLEGAIDSILVSCDHKTLNTLNRVTNRLDDILSNTDGDVTINLTPLQGKVLKKELKKFISIWGDKGLNKIIKGLK